MNREEALELLSQVRPLDQWRRHDAHSTYDPTNQATTAPAYPRFNHVAQQMSFPPVKIIIDFVLNKLFFNFFYLYITYMCIYNIICKIIYLFYLCSNYGIFEFLQLLYYILDT